MHTKVANKSLEFYVMNASGPDCSEEAELLDLERGYVGAVVIKSSTLEPREGNFHPRYQRLEHGSIQCMGLPNKGAAAYAQMIGKLKIKVPIIASIFGNSTEEYIEVTKKFANSKADLLEINISCPNADDEPIGYSIDETDRLLYEIVDLTDKPLGLKLPPYFIKREIEEMSSLIKEHHIQFITCINSVPNCLVIDADKECSVIKPNNGLGGLCGSYIKPIALANVRQFYNRLENSVSIIGVGGINSGKDAFEFLLAGADAVQVATCYEKEGPGCFYRINNELTEILGKKGYRSIDEAKGQLKQIV